MVGRVVLAAVLASLLLVASTALAIWWTARQDSRPPSDAIVVLGGPAMLIGLGGGAASSVASGESQEALDFASVQRDNPEMERRCQEVIDACMALGEANPVVAIHDVGAGGLSNAVPELLHDAGVGGELSLDAIPCADPALSPMERWCNESQERYVLAVRPDAVFVAASSTPATTPIIELRARGFTGPIYTVQGIAGPDALRVGGKALDGVMFSSVPVLVAEQLPDEHPVKAQALRFIAAYEAKHGPGSRNLFGATLWDAYLLVAAGAEEAAKSARPGTPEFRRALRDANLDVAEVDYLNAHGTSTPLNDPNEAKAIRAVFGEHADRVLVSSTKSATGHMLGAAGVVEFVACALAIRDGVVPPTINHATPDPEIALDVVPNTPRPRRVRVAISNSSGFGGHNATLALRSYEE